MGELDNPSLFQKDCWTSFQLQAIESLHEQGHLLVVGGYFLKLGVADSLGLLGHFLGVVVQLCCLD